MNRTELADIVPKGTVWDSDEWWTYDQVKQVAEEYAKIEAIAFIEWATVGDWYRYSSTTPWRKDQIEATTEELYQLYQDSKNQVI